ncbi:HD domain-containing phosphohydrolase [Candidatus Omnitrophota bacterium]
METSDTRILLFDRDPESQKLFGEIAGELGLDIVTVSDRESGLAELSSCKPRLIIASDDFPKLPGFVLLEEIARKNLDIPVAIISSQPENLIKALRSGAVDFFRKPVFKAEIASRIPAILKKNRESIIHPPSGNNTEKIRKLERDIKELNDLLRISSSLDVTGDSRRILQRLSDVAAESTGFEAASIMLVNKRENVLEFVVASGEKGGRLETLKIPMGEGIAGWVALHGKPQVVNDTTTDERFTGKVDDESGFVTKQILAVPMKLDGEIIGILEVINSKDGRVLSDDDVRVLGELSDRAALVIGTSKTIESQQNFYIQVTNILVKAIEKKDTFGEGHSWRVAELCHKVGNAFGLDEDEMNDLYFSSLLHDIGKLEVPGVLLNKRNLSERERDLLRQHPVKGAKLIEQIIVWKSAVPGILYHHENWDGSGYPFGHSGKSIPLGARIVNIAESFTVMRSPTTYKRQMTLKETILEIMRGAGKQFDPNLVRLFIKVLEQETSLRSY